MQSNVPLVTDWITAVASFLSAIGLIVGIVVAFKQLNIWKSEAKTNRKREVAEELLLSANKAMDVLRQARHLMDRVPPEKADDRKFTYERRMKILAEANPIFESLRYAQIRAASVLQDTELENAAKSIVQSRVELFVELELIVENLDNPAPDDEEFRKMLTEARRTVFGTWSERDTFGSKLLADLKLIELRTGPFVRMET